MRVGNVSGIRKAGFREAIRRPTPAIRRKPTRLPLRVSALSPRRPDWGLVDLVTRNVSEGRDTSTRLRFGFP